MAALSGESFNDMAFLVLVTAASHVLPALPTTHKAFCYKEKAVTKVAHTVSKPTAFSYLRSVLAMSNLLALKVR